MPRRPAPAPPAPDTREVLTLDALAGNDKNPRLPWKPEQVEPFKASLLRFGDLGGIVRNLTTDRLVGGHKRVEVFRESADVRVVKHDQDEDAQGTVAHGYVVVDGSRFAYREVRWTEDIEAAANLAANRWGAEWSWELVSETLQGITAPDLLALTGFPQHELDNLLAASWTPQVKEAIEEAGESHPHQVKLSDEQYAALQECKKRFEDEGATFTDAATIARLCAECLADGA